MTHEGYGSGREKVLDRAQDTLAEMCWCGHDYHHHTDSDTPFCAYPLYPEDDGFWEDYEDATTCKCDGYYPMNEDAPEHLGGEVRDA